MQIPVLLERLKGNGYRACGTEPFAISAKGATREEAIGKLQQKIRARLKNGKELISLEVGPEPDPWLEIIGVHKDDPWIADWKKSVEEYRARRKRPRRLIGLCVLDASPSQAMELPKS